MPMHSPLLLRLASSLRLFIAVLALGLIVFSFVWVFTRPLRSAQRGDNAITLRVLHWAGGGGSQEEAIVKALIQSFVDDYNSRNERKLRIQRINPGDAAAVYTKLQTMMAAGDPPDVFYLGNERVASFASKELLAPIEPFIAADRAAGRETIEIADFFPATLDCFRFDGATTGRGTIYGLPKDFTTIGFYYNKDLFQRAGVPFPQHGWTWDEFVSAARQIAKLEGQTGAHIVSWPAMIRAYLWTEGVDVCSDDFRELYTDDPRVIAALERLRAWRFDESGTLTSGSTQVTIEESLFMAGNLGMAGPFGRWVVPAFSNIDKFDWDFVPLPRGSVRANCVFTVAWGIARDSRHPSEAWELVKHLCGPKGQAQNAGFGLAIPALRSVANSPAFVDPAIKPANDQAYLDAAEYARAMIWPTTPKFEARLKAAVEGFYKSGNLAVAPALAEFAGEWRRELSSPLASPSHPRMPWPTISAWIAVPLAALLLITLAIWWLRRPSGGALREELAGYGMIAPWVIGFLVFTTFPIVLSLLLALTRWSGVTPLAQAQSVGLGNWVQMLFYDEIFRQSLRVTVVYALIAVPLSQIAALIAAVLMNNDVRGIGFFRSAWYLPSVLAGVGVAVLWRWVFDDTNGLLNQALAPIAALFNATPPSWLNRDAAVWGAPAFALMGVWTIGGSMMIYLAGLKGIPQELYEAASIDGANWLRRLRNVTLPMLSPVILFNVIMAIIGSFQVFTQSYVMTSGGPGDDTRFYVLYLFNQAFDYHEMGYASAMAWLLLIIVLALTLTVMSASRRFVYYEALK